ncbi:hypothetical protein CK203_038022 [Vitis vinifera]|uniref:DUF4283 domain-containing protein n=1 Tax=Vitis vinifera TaxID=29760 RepID=A0A438HNY2_VITVI|nr:hypothetical protein CK203_038022 [Vitis vinifera]
MRLLFCMIIKTTINKAKWASVSASVSSGHPNALRSRIALVTRTNTMVSIRVRVSPDGQIVMAGWEPCMGRVISRRKHLLSQNEEVKKSEFLLVPNERGVLNLFFKREGSQRGQCQKEDPIVEAKFFGSAKLRNVVWLEIEKGVIDSNKEMLKGNLHLALLEGPLILFEYEDVVQAETMLHIGVKWFKGEAYGHFVGVDDDKAERRNLQWAKVLVGVNSKPLADIAFLEEVLIFQGTLSSSHSSWEEGPSSSTTHFWVPNSSTLGKD